MLYSGLHEQNDIAYELESIGNKKISVLEYETRKIKEIVQGEWVII